VLYVQGVGLFAFFLRRQVKYRLVREARFTWADVVAR